MTKDIPSFEWPGMWHDEGKTFRAILERAARETQSGKEPMEVYNLVLKNLESQKGRVGKLNVDGAVALAFAYLGFLMTHGVVTLNEETYR